LRPEETPGELHANLRATKANAQYQGLTEKIGVSNDSSAFVTLWREDYGMSPGDKFEVVAADVADGFYFQVSYDDKGIKLYAEGGAKFVSVYQAGELLGCGHNRRREES
jgi:hypothetical protein